MAGLLPQQASLLPSILRSLLPAACNSAQHAFNVSQTRGYAAGGLSHGFIEVREYTAQPGHFNDYLKITEEYANVRKELLPFLGMFTCDVGGVMHRLVHFYAYRDFDHRDAARATAGRDPRWRKYITDSRKYLSQQTSRVLLEEPSVYDMLDGPDSCSQFISPPRDSKSLTDHVMYELRTYNLPSEQGAVRKLVDALDKSLPDKVPELLAPCEKGHLVLFGHSDVGPRYQVTELWRWHSAQACWRARHTSWAMPTLFHHVANAMSHDQRREFLHPTSFSTWQ